MHTRANYCGLLVQGLCNISSSACICIITVFRTWAIYAIDSSGMVHIMHPVVAELFVLRIGLSSLALRLWSREFQNKVRTLIKFLSSLYIVHLLLYVR